MYCFFSPFQSNKSRLNLVSGDSRDVLSTCVPLLKRIWQFHSIERSLLLIIHGIWKCLKFVEFSIFILLWSSLLLGLMKVCVCGKGDYREVKILRAHQRWLRPEVLRAFKHLSAPCLSWIILLLFKEPNQVQANLALKKQYMGTSIYTN